LIAPWLRDVESILFAQPGDRKVRAFTMNAVFVHLERFPEKWPPVFGRKRDKQGNLEHVSNLQKRGCALDERMQLQRTSKNAAIVAPP
jgi:hypothetical protein